MVKIDGLQESRIKEFQNFWILIRLCIIIWQCDPFSSQSIANAHQSDQSSSIYRPLHRPSFWRPYGIWNLCQRTM